MLRPSVLSQSPPTMPRPNLSAPRHRAHRLWCNEPWTKGGRCLPRMERGMKDDPMGPTEENGRETEETNTFVQKHPKEPVQCGDVLVNSPL